MAGDSATVAIAFTPVPAKQSPNLRRTDDGAAAAAYYRATVVTFASIRRWNPSLDLVLVTDVAPPTEFADQLGELGVRELTQVFEHRPPQGFWPTFNASLYSIDAISALARTLPPGQRILLIDPDIVCTGELSPVIDQISSGGWLAYPMGYPLDEKSQGLSALDAAELHRQLDEALTEPPVHYGGEIYGFTPEGAAPVLKRCEEAWSLALANWEKQQPHFVTEEHLLNYALRSVEVIDVSSYIRRIWTTPVLRDVVGDEFKLLLWHLPAEKDRGFPALAVAQDRESWFWQADRNEFVRRCGRIFGIPRRRPKRWTYDTAGSTVRALQRRMQRRERRS